MTTPPLAVTRTGRPSRRHWLWYLLSVLVLLATCAVAVPVVIIYATAGPNGAACAECAADAWIASMSADAWNRDGWLTLQPNLAATAIPRLRAQRDAFIAAIRIDAAAFPQDNGVTFVGLSATATTTAETMLVVPVLVQWPALGDPTLVYDSEALPWTFALIRDHDGWHIRTVDMPAWCGAYSRCQAPSASPDLTPTAMPTGIIGLQDALTPMLPCGPADPFRQWHDCPSPSLSGP